MSPQKGSLAYEAHTEKTKSIEAVKSVILVIINPDTTSSYHTMMVHPQHASIILFRIKVHLTFSLTY